MILPMAKVINVLSVSLFDGGNRKSTLHRAAHGASSANTSWSLLPGALSQNCLLGSFKLDFLWKAYCVPGCNPGATDPTVGKRQTSPQ